MAESYAEDDVSTWSPEQRKLYDETWHGLIDGDLKPLEAYLRSDFPIPRSLRQDIADCILGEDTLHRIQCKKRRSGPGGIREAVAYHLKIRQVAEYIDSRIPKGSRGHLPNAIHDAAQHFGTSESNIRKMRNEYRRRAKAGHAGGVYHMRGWGRLYRPNRISDVAVGITNSDG